MDPRKIAALQQQDAEAIKYRAADHHNAVQAQTGAVDEARADLARSFVEFIDREADLVKGLSQQSKKDLAREVIRLRAMVKAMRSAASKSGY